MLPFESVLALRKDHDDFQWAYILLSLVLDGPVMLEDVGQVSSIQLQSILKVCNLTVDLFVGGNCTLK